MSLPPFLELIPRLPFQLTTSGFINALFRHTAPLGPAHSLWWPPKLAAAKPETVILFIPGNPGLLDFYTPYLSTIYYEDTTSKLAIFGHSHLGHTPGIETEGAFYQSAPTCYGLSAQVEAALQAFDAIKSTFGHDTRVVLVGHSVGAWLALQVLKARPAAVSAVFLLFPTISHIKDTPNGRRIFWLFSPRMRSVIAWLSYLTRLLPVNLLSKLYHDWPLPQVHILQALLHSPATIHATLLMAYDEMQSIKDLDISLLDAHKSKLRFYFAEQDAWVGEERSNILRSFNPTPEDVQVVHGQQDIPHAFCINHGETVALQCHQWLIDSFRRASS